MFLIFDHNFLEGAKIRLKPKLSDSIEIRSAKRLRIPQACGTKNAGIPSRSCEQLPEVFLTQQVSACLPARQAYRFVESLNLGKIK